MVLLDPVVEVLIVVGVRLVVVLGEASVTNLFLCTMLPFASVWVFAREVFWLLLEETETVDVYGSELGDKHKADYHNDLEDATAATLDPDSLASVQGWRLWLGVYGFG